MPQPIEEYEESSISQSLTSLYDDVIYWELAKGSNQFYVTFEKGRYAIPNNKQESIGTMEITYPHVISNSGSTKHLQQLAASSSKRIGADFDIFLEGAEKHFPGSPQGIVGQGYNYHGFIPLTELKGSRYFQTTITSSVFDFKTIHYQISGSNGLVSAQRNVSASYFYPFSSHQLSVLRKNSALIIDLDADNELPEGVGRKGYVLLPEDFLKYYIFITKHNYNGILR